MAGSATPPSQRPKKRVSYVQAKNRRVLAVLLLAFVIFLFRRGCVACVRSHDKKESQTAAETTTVATTVLTSEETTVTTTAPLQTDATTVTTTAVLPTEYLIPGEIPSSYLIEVDPILQNPELPTGCEITTLSMLLSAVGFDVDKVQLADGYLTCESEGEATFKEAFIGSPYNTAGYGCYASVIVDTARKYLSAQNSGRIVRELTGVDFEDLLREVASNHPVAVWASINLVDIEEVYAYTIYDYVEKTENGGTTEPKDLDVYWLENEHAFLLKGYDLDRGVVIVNDPLNGEMEYPIDRFKECYAQCYRQAVIIY